MNLSSVKFRPITVGVTVVLGESHGEVMTTRKILLGAHIHIAMFRIVQHGVDTPDRRDTQRSRRQPHILIGIIR